MKSTRKIAAVLMAAVLAWAGTACAHAAAKPAPKNVYPRMELFAGYSYWSPHAQVQGYSFVTNSRGMIFSGAYFFNQWAGAQIEGERAQQTNNDGMRAFSVGPIFRLPGKELTPFVHALVGTAGVTGPNQPTVGGSTFFYNPEHWGVMLTAGAGMDYTTPWLHHRLGFRIFQADYQYTHVDFGPKLATQGGRANIAAVRLSTGITYSFSKFPWRR